MKNPFIAILPLVETFNAMGYYKNPLHRYSALRNIQCNNSISVGRTKKIHKNHQTRLAKSKRRYIVCPVADSSQPTTSKGDLNNV